MEWIYNKNIKIDNAGFDREMEKSKKLARANWKGSGDKSLEEKWFKVREELSATEFLGYDHDKAEGVILKISKDNKFIEEAKIWLRRHGGNLFQLYPLAMAAKLNFDSRLDKFNQYVEKAHEIGEVLNTLPSVTVLPYPVKTNMLHFEFPKSKAHLQNQMKDYKEKGFDIGMGIWLEEPKGVSRLELSVGDATLRLSKEEIRELFQALLES